MTCAALEVLLCDYVEGTLNPPERELVQRHLQTCAACAALARDAAAAVAFIQHAEQPQPPAELLTRILFQLPAGGRQYIQQESGVSGWLAARLRPLLQPRFAMGMAMTILSFSILGRFAGISPRQLTPSDLHPAKVWQALDDRAHRAWERARKFYQSLRVVYELQTQLREWAELRKEEEARSAQPGGGVARTGAEPALPGSGVDSSRPDSPPLDAPRARPPN